MEYCMGNVMYKAKVELNKLDPDISRCQPSKRSLGSLATVGRQIQRRVSADRLVPSTISRPLEA
jgi:hypothetical protein